MIIERNSPLRNLPATSEPAQSKFLDAIRLSIECVDISYERLCRNLDGVRKADQAGRSQLSTSALYDAWSIIDSVHRLRCLVNAMPGYKRIAASKQIFIRATEGVEILRNTIQHLNNEIQALVKEKQPVLGSITWYQVIDREEKRRSMSMLIPGQWAHLDITTQFFPSRELGDDIDEITLSTTAGSICLSEIVRAVVQLTRSLEKMISHNMDTSSTNLSDHYCYFEFVLEDDEPLQPEP